MTAKSWLLLVYKIPREPTAGRVHVWRKLKQLGAIALQDAIWVLPRTARTQEQLQWLAAEIAELGGDALLWEAEQLYATDADRLRLEFAQTVESEYRDILAALKKKDRDLAELSKRFRRAQERDFFASELATRVRKRLLGEGGGMKP
jgi:DNA-binding transcriptional regulator PaaX